MGFTRKHIHAQWTVFDMTRLRLVAQTVARDAAPAAPRRKARNPHRGVFLVPPAPPKRPHWAARYRDVETGKVKFRPLTVDEARTTESRRDLAISIHKTLGRRRDEIAAGATPHAEADMSLADAFDRYFADWGTTKSEHTRVDYRTATDLFLEWCKPAGVRTVRQLTKGILNRFAASRAAVPKLAGAITKRGKRTRVVGKRSNGTTNRELRSLSAVLNKLRKMEIVRLTRDDIADGLEELDTLQDRKGFYRAAQLAEILAACERHDAEVFKFTRKDRADGNWAGHEQPRYEPVLAVVLFILLTGLRAKEARAIQWADVDVAGGEINVPAPVAKTRRARGIDMSISPLLAALVSEPGKSSAPVLSAHWTKAAMQSARKRLIADYGAPEFSFQGLRRTCGTFLTCAPAIYGAASAYMSAKRLGHSVSIAEKHYVGVVKVSPEARTVEAAMQLAVTPASCPRL